MQPGVRVSQLLNIAFDFAAYEHLGSLANGCTVCLRGNSSAQWRAVLETVDVLLATPSMLARHHPADYPNIKKVMVGGEQCPQGTLYHLSEPSSELAGRLMRPELADLWSRYVDFQNGSGPTEVTMGNTLDRFVYGRRVSIGTPVPNTTIYILDENLQPVPVGETGLMWCGGSALSRGYLNRPDKTAERFRPDPFLTNGCGMMYNTGDLGRFRQDGSLDHLGRLDDLVKVNGFRVELDGVSAAMSSCPGVDLAVALMVGKEMWGFVTPETAQQEVVRDHTATLYPYYAVPTKYLSLSTFPLTRNGKVDKTALRCMAERTEVTPLTIPRNIPAVPSTPPLDTSSSSSSSPTLSSVLMTPNIDDDSVGLERGSKRQSSYLKASPDQFGFDAPDSSTLRGLYPNDVNIVLS
jgi:acyl-coenzyme A synthetase/AMP-(fatty) acid ligase